MSIGIILAGGKGTRMNSQLVNKVATLFLNKPLISYGVELFEDLVDKTIIVVGAYPDSVKKVIKKDVTYIDQSEQLGTGHAIQMVYKSFNKELKQYKQV